ncbi:Na+/H+ antiporter NhaA [Chryseobacterium sp. NEB161]|nr:Na+/H+ antiporter NhaA [Chryseobacterium sp. NEB161]
MIIYRYFNQFVNNSKSAGILLLILVLISLCIANSSFANSFQHVLDYQIGTEILHLKYPISVWINDGLMAIFFLYVGLEIKRELLRGELADIRQAALPIVAAFGGMVFPAVIYLVFNHNTSHADGWAIPMATDIAFSLAIISMLGKNIPTSLKIFLSALAIVDDLGAIIVIALFYTDSIDWVSLGICGGITIFLIILNKTGIKNLLFYLVPGLLLWYFMHHSGIHATIAGVILAFTIPLKNPANKISPSEKLEKQLHLPVSFLIMPLFALVNTNITFEKDIFNHFINPLSAGIILGLFAGKVLGINILSWLAIKIKWAKLPANCSFKEMLGVGFLAGIGFTMSIFVALLAFPKDFESQNISKISILAASVISGVTGYIILRYRKSGIRHTA